MKKVLVLVAGLMLAMASAFADGEYREFEVIKDYGAETMVLRYKIYGALGTALYSFTIERNGVVTNSIKNDVPFVRENGLFGPTWSITTVIGKHIITECNDGSVAVFVFGNDGGMETLEGRRVK